MTRSRPAATSPLPPVGTWPPEFPPPGPTPPAPPGYPAPQPPPSYPPVPMVYETVPSPTEVTDRLLDRRVVLVFGELDLRRASEATGRLLVLERESDEPIELRLSCPDGELTASSALADAIEVLGVEVHTVAGGSVGGPAVLPFAVATRRLAQPHATFRLAEPSAEMTGPASQVATETELHAERLAELRRRLAAATGQPEERMAEDLRHRRSLTAVDARAYGLVDEILRRHHLRTV